MTSDCWNLLISTFCTRFLQVTFLVTSIWEISSNSLPLWALPRSSSGRQTCGGLTRRLARDHWKILKLKHRIHGTGIFTYIWLIFILFIYRCNIPVPWILWDYNMHPESSICFAFVFQLHLSATTWCTHAADLESNEICSEKLQLIQAKVPRGNSVSPPSSTSFKYLQLAQLSANINTSHLLDISCLFSQWTVRIPKTSCRSAVDWQYHFERYFLQSKEQQLINDFAALAVVEATSAPPKNLKPLSLLRNERSWPLVQC